MASIVDISHSGLLVTLSVLVQFSYCEEESDTTPETSNQIEESALFLPRLYFLPSMCNTCVQYVHRRQKLKLLT